jgi:hypothetical protein
MPELGAPVDGTVELIPDIAHGSHITQLNDPRGVVIPART